MNLQKTERQITQCNILVVVCGVAGGITYTTADKIMLAMDSELEFREFESFKPDYIS